MITTNFVGLKKQIENFAFGVNRVILNCGHLLLFSVPEYQNRVFSSIVNETSNKSINNYILKNFGVFSDETFKMGIELYNEIKEKGKDCSITLLVNDWQKIKKDNNRSNSEPNEHRQKFYNNFRQPPNKYLSIVKDHNLSDIQWIGDNDIDFFFFRETRLRDRFKRKLKNLSKSQFFALDQQQCLASCSEFKHHSDSNSYFHVSTNNGITKIAENGKVGCAGEISQLISELNKKEINSLLINILPFSCSESVNLGVEMAFDIETDLNLRVVNIFPVNNNNPMSEIIINDYAPIYCE